MPLQIDSYSFGKMRIGDQTFTNDLMIHPNADVHRDWRRGEGHLLVPRDIAALLDAGPEKLIVGTGAFGRMRVSGEVKKLCRTRGIELYASRTGTAVQHYNTDAAAGRRIAACFHLTC